MQKGLIVLRLALFTRFPTPGRAKTRLIPLTGPELAAQVHARLAERTVGVLRAAEPSAKLEIHFTGADKASFADWLGPVHLVEQADGGLTERLLAAMHPAPVIFFGADTPELMEHHVRAAVAGLTHHDVMIGPSEDGGYYLIGLKCMMPFLFDAMPWSTEQVFSETLRRLTERGIKPLLLDTLADCDRPEDLQRWPWLTA